LRQSAVMIRFEPLGGNNGSLDPKGLERGKDGTRNRIVNLHRADAETVNSATICDVVAGTIVTRRSRATGVVSAQFAATLPQAARAVGDQALRRGRARAPATDDRKAVRA
jgi:hypothetical protein